MEVLLVLKANVEKLGGNSKFEIVFDENTYNSAKEALSGMTIENDNSFVFGDITVRKGTN